jgi:hypothetical protein
VRKAALLLTMLGLGVGASPALAAAPPTLDGEGFSGTLYAFGGEFGCRAEDGTSVVTFRVGTPSGLNTSLQGPYRGDYEDRLEMRIGPPDTFSESEILAASGTFTVDAPVGQVTASFRLDPAAGHGDKLTAGGCEDVHYVNAQLRYTATIITSDGIFVDRGRTPFNVSQHRPNQPVYEATHLFDSDLSVPEQNESALFGRRVPGESWSAMSTNTKRGSPFVLWFPATVRKVYAYIDGKGAATGSQTIRAVLYRHNGGPGAYVTRSFEFTVPAGMTPRWVPLWLAPVPRLDPGVYWIGLQSGADHGLARYAWSSSPGARRYNVDVFADGASDPFGPGFSDDQQMSLLAAGSY